MRKEEGGTTKEETKTYIPNFEDYYPCFFQQKTKEHVLSQQHPPLAGKQSQWLTGFHFLLLLYSTAREISYSQIKKRMKVKRQQEKQKQTDKTYKQCNNSNS